MIKKLILLVIGGLSIYYVIGIAHKLQPPTNHANVNNEYEPVLNPDPKYFMVVHGHVDPALQKKLDLTIIERFTTYNDKCRYFRNFSLKFEGVSSSRVKNINYITKYEQNGDYSIKIPLNKYQEGMCRWQIYAIGYIFKPEFPTLGYVTNTIGFSSNGESLRNRDFYQTWICKANNCELKNIKYPKKYQPNIILSSHANYDFTLNFEEIK